MLARRSDGIVSGRRRGQVKNGRRTNGQLGDADQSNVVRLPVDWIGPREDLVPFGPSADQHPDMALGADAFWGEQAASLHQAIEAPAEVAAAPAAAAGRFAPGPPESVLSGDRPVRPVSPPLHRRLRGAVPHPAWRLSYGALVAAGGSVAAALAALVLAGGPATSSPR